MRSVTSDFRLPKKVTGPEGRGHPAPPASSAGGCGKSAGSAAAGRPEAELSLGTRGGACSLRGRTLPRARGMSLEAPGLAAADAGQLEGSRALALPEVIVYLCAIQLPPSPRPASTFLSQ